MYYGVSDAGRDVALKLLQHNTEVELRGIQQCLNLSHPNLVTIFDVRTDRDGDHWVVMEYVSGETLETIIQRHPQGMPVEQVRKWLAGIGGGIRFLHQSGLVHRDLKPANLFIQNETVKVGDVGLSKFISPSRRSAHTQSVGTVYYMAPEVARGRYGKAVDLYAMGIILFEMLTGDLPFNGESTGEILMKHLTEKPDLSRISPRLQPVIAKVLEKDPLHRYDSVDEFLAAFETAIVGRNVETPLPDFRTTASTGWPNDLWQGPAKTDAEHLYFTQFRKQFQREQNQSVPPGEIHKDPKSSSSAKSCRGRERNRWCHWKTRWNGTRGKRPSFLAAPVLIPVLVMAIVIASRKPHFPVAALIFNVGAAWLTLAVIHRHRERKSSPSVRVPLANAIPLRSHRTHLPVHQQLARRQWSIGHVLAAGALTAPVVSLLSVLLMTLRPVLFSLPGSKEIDPGLGGFFILVAILACWGIVLTSGMIARKESHESLGSRLIFAFTGAAVGMASWKIQQFLMVELPLLGDLQSRSLVHQVGDYPLASLIAGPTGAGYVIFFSTFFFLRRWKFMTSPLRRQRFRIGAVFMTLLAAWGTTRIFDFSTSWGLAWGLVIACSVQLCSVWDPSPRPHAIRNFP